MTFVAFTKDFGYKIRCKIDHCAFKFLSPLGIYVPRSILIARLDVEKANGETSEQLLQLVPTYESLAASSKVHLIQSLVSRLLVDRIFNEYFIGLSKEHADDLSKVEKYLGEFGETNLTVYGL